MTAIDIAERNGKLRAILFYAIAAALLLLLIATFSGGSSFFNGLWAGLMLGASLNLTPLARWLKPDHAIARLLEDESTREHRRMATTTGFWAAIVTTGAITVATHEGTVIAAYDAVRIIGTAAMTAALVAFATLELRATR